MADLTIRFSKEVRRFTVVAETSVARTWLIASVIGASAYGEKVVAYMEEDEIAVFRSMARNSLMSMKEETN